MAPPEGYPEGEHASGGSSLQGALSLHLRGVRRLRFPARRRIREMRQPGAGCNAPAAIVTALAQFVAVGEATPAACVAKPIDYSYSLGYHVSGLPCTPHPACMAWQEFWGIDHSGSALRKLKA